jgi:hypothetical protein
VPEQESLAEVIERHSDADGRDLRDHSEGFRFIVEQGTFAQLERQASRVKLGLTEDVVSSVPARPTTRTRRAQLPAGAFAVPAPRPAAGPTLAFLQLLLRPANATLSGRHLLGVLNPADELVAGQGRDVLPGIECRDVGNQRPTQVRGEFMHDPAGHTLAAHRLIVVGWAGRGTRSG